jgi:2-dehydro-3-deoxygluconokinase
MAPEVVSLGEPLLEFNAVEPGLLREVSSYEVGWGGDTSNFAIAVARLGGSVGYVSRIGADDFGQIFIDLWEAEGVDTRYVVRDGSAPTGIYFVSRRGETHAFTYYRQGSAASGLQPEDVPEDYIASARVLHTSGITQAISTSAADAVFHAIDVARRAGVLVSYDPNVRLSLWGLGRARAIIRETIRLADFVLPSLEDARIITGSDNPEVIAAELLALGPRAVALKLGGEGVLLATQDSTERCLPIRVDVVDTTGAGDAFDGAFIVAYLRGEPLAQCVRFANAAAALSTRGWGAVAPIPDRAAVEDHLRRLD